jgi:hypothetical protein
MSSSPTIILSQKACWGGAAISGACLCPGCGYMGYAVNFSVRASWFIAMEIGVSSIPVSEVRTPLSPSRSCWFMVTRS